MLLLVSLNLPQTIERLERAAELESQAISQIKFTQLNARIRCLKKSIIRAVTLSAVLQAIFSDSDTLQLAAVLSRWFEEDSQVTSICLFDTRGKERLSLSRKDGQLSITHHDRNPSEQEFFQHTLFLHENQIVVQLVRARSGALQLTDAENQTLLMSVPVVDTGQQVVGLMVMRTDLTRFLQDYQDADNRKIAWLPLVFNVDDRAVMWVGTIIDESTIKQWKFFLMINVLGVILGLSLFVYISAFWISGRIDRIRKDLLHGLDVIINEEKPVEFRWNGPLEVKSLARDLTALSQHYQTTCEARNAAELAVRESEDTFRNLTASALDGIILMDKQGNVPYWNEAAANIFGYSSQEAMKQSMHSLIDLRRVDEIQGLVRVDQMKRDENLARTLELTARHSDGHDVIVELSLSSARIKK